MLKVKIVFAIFAVALYGSSCTAIRKSKNRSSINFASRNTELVKECAAFAIAATAGTKITTFRPEDITDKKMRKKIASLGSEITVNYRGHDNYEIPDSTVTFESTSVLMGITSFIYDFANNPRTYPNSGSRKGDYYFVKIADRIYYRKRAFPMM